MSQPEIPEHIFRINAQGLVEAIDIKTGRVIAVQSTFDDLLKRRSDRLVKINTPEGPVWIEKTLNFDMVGRLKAWPYSQLLGDLVCEKVTLGVSLVMACEELGVPYSIVKKWERESPEFKESLALARKDGAEYSHGKILELARTRGDAKTEIEALKWSAEKNDPERFGNKTKLVGDTSAPITFVIDTGIRREAIPEAPLEREVTPPAQEERETKEVGYEVPE